MEFDFFLNLLDDSISLVDLLVADTKRIWSALGSEITVPDDIISDAQGAIRQRLEKLYQFVGLPINDRQNIEEVKDIVFSLKKLPKETIPNRIFNAIEYAEAKISILTSDEVSVSTLVALTGFTFQGVSQAIKRKKISGKKIGNMWFIKSESAIQWLLDRKEIKG